MSALPLQLSKYLFVVRNKDWHWGMNFVSVQQLHIYTKTRILYPH